jgi:O-antigen ligase
MLAPFEILFALATALSSLSSNAMGLAWLLLMLAGLWASVYALRSGQWLKVPTWVGVWLAVSLAVLLLKTVPMIYWSDPWAERHGELRLFLGALGIYAVVASNLFERPRLLSTIAYALSLSSLMGLLWVSVFGRDAVATHPIPWAGGMAMVSAWLLALGLKSDFAPVARRIWLTGGLFAMLAVLSSRSRGVFGIVVWWALICSHHLWRHYMRPMGTPPFQSAGLKSRSPIVGAAVLIATCWALSYTPVLQRPTEAVYEAIEQFEISKASPAAGSNSSVGSRIFMWQKSLLAIQASPWIGYGHDGRKQLLSQWADEAHSTEIHQLGHVHNEYLNQLIDHGLWGLASQLCLLLGLMWICWALFKVQEITAALALSGVTFVHLTASFFNVNFAHNYYTASLSTLIGLCLLIPKIKFQ